MPKNKMPKKVLVIGSGGIKIAEAAEFDYSSSQSLKALRDLGIESIIMNPNIATVQTSYSMADKVYILPINSEYIKRVIAIEKPDGILAGFGGQTALSACLSLWDEGFLQDNGVEFLGTKPDGIKNALGRGDFQKLMKKNRISVPPSMVVKSVEEGVEAVKKIGLPVMCRVSFNLGGRGSFIAHSMKEYMDSIEKALAQSGTHEALVEKYLDGWKELEYEVMRDIDGNAAVIACLENIDPMGTHTGESVVVAPAQTLDNYIYQEMRSIAIRVAEAIELVGECNVQFALSPNSYDYYVIETNPRMSRSSALASKVTGYPIAHIATKLAMGIKMHELQNEISTSTNAFFEPSLDYIAIKIPRWDIVKFERAENSLGSEMKSIGEVMGIGRNFEEALQKAVRMLDIGEQGIMSSQKEITSMGKNDAIEALRDKRPYWFLYAAQALLRGATINELAYATKINSFFLSKISNLVDVYKEFFDIEKDGKKPTTEDMLKLGFSEKQLGIDYVPKNSNHIDTLAGEWPSNANYMYLTQNSSKKEPANSEHSDGAIVLGAGCFRIGVSVEFDYATTMIALSANRLSKNFVVLNCNPETVSTDWNIPKMLFFDELSPESIRSVSKETGIRNLILFSAGQIGNNIAEELGSSEFKILGSSPKSIAAAEDRESFSKIVEELGINEPEWARVLSLKDALKFAGRVGYPVLIRPSFVLSGSAMGIARNENELKERIRKMPGMYSGKPVVISKFLDNADEADLDCAADGKAVIGIPLFHIEEAGVHSGDSTMAIYPSSSEETKIREPILEKMERIALALVERLAIRGPFNLQFAIKEGVPYVIELNIRASRSMPFSSKSTGIELIDYALKGSMENFGWNGFRTPKINSYGIKSPQFSWAQIKGAYPALGPEMRSTGEVASFGRSFNSALIKSWISAMPNRIPRETALVYGNGDYDGKICDILAKKGLKAYTIEENRGQKNSMKIADAVKRIKKNGIQAVFTDGSNIRYDYELRRACADFNVPIVLNRRLGEALAKALGSEADSEELKDYW